MSPKRCRAAQENWAHVGPRAPQGSPRLVSLTQWHTAGQGAPCGTRGLPCLHEHTGAFLGWTAFESEL